MKLNDVYIGQRVKLNRDADLAKRTPEISEGDVYHIGVELISVEFDYLGTVAGLHPEDVTPAEGAKR